jgi:hypothetical protein
MRNQFVLSEDERFKIDTINQAQEIVKKLPPILSFIFDDGFIEDDLTYSIFKEYNMTCGFAIISDYVLYPEKNPLNKIRQYSKEGFSILSHSVTHSSMSESTLSSGFVGYEFNKSKNDLNSYGFNISGFVTPYSELHENYLPNLKKNYSYAFTKYAGVIPDDGVCYHTRYDNPHKLSRVSLKSNSIDKIKLAIDKCIENKGIIYFYEHRVGHPDWISESTLREILDYVKIKMDNKECLVLSPDIASQNFFGIELKQNKKNFITKNLCPDLNKFGTLLSKQSWFLSGHGTEIGETGVLSTVNSYNYYKIQYPTNTNINIGKSNSIQLAFDLKNIDMNIIENRNIYFGMDIYTDADVTVTLNCKFVKEDGSSGVTLENIYDVDNRNKRIETCFSPVENNVNFDYVLIYPKIVFKSVQQNKFVQFANPIIGIGTEDKQCLYKKEFTSVVNTSYVNNLSSPTIPCLTWTHFSGITNNQFANGLSDDTGTLIINESGLYYITVILGFKVADSSSVDTKQRVLIEIGTSDWSSNLGDRTEYHYTPPNDNFTIVGTTLLNLKKSDKVFVKAYFDSPIGTCTLMSNTPYIKLKKVNF